MNAVEQIRNSINVMRKYKQDNRLISDLRVFVSEDVFAELKQTEVMTQNAVGKYLLDGVHCFELKDYPKGYISVE